MFKICFNFQNVKIKKKPKYILIMVINKSKRPQSLKLLTRSLSLLSYATNTGEEKSVIKVILGFFS